MIMHERDRGFMYRNKTSQNLLDERYTSTMVLTKASHAKHHEPYYEQNKKKNNNKKNKKEGPSPRLLALYNTGVQKLRKRNNIVHRFERLKRRKEAYQQITSKEECNLEWYERLFNLSKNRNEYGANRRKEIEAKRNGPVYKRKHFLPKNGVSTEKVNVIPLSQIPIFKEKFPSINFDDVQGGQIHITLNEDVYTIYLEEIAELMNHFPNIDIADILSAYIETHQEATDELDSRSPENKFHADKMSTEEQDTRDSPEEDLLEDLISEMRDTNSIEDCRSFIQNEPRHIDLSNIDEFIVYSESLDSQLSFNSTEYITHSQPSWSWEETFYSFEETSPVEKNTSFASDESIGSDCERSFGPSIDYDSKSRLLAPCKKIISIEDYYCDCEMIDGSDEEGIWMYESGNLSSCSSDYFSYYDQVYSYSRDSSVFDYSISTKFTSSSRPTYLSSEESKSGLCNLFVKMDEKNIIYLKCFVEEIEAVLLKKISPRLDMKKVRIVRTQKGFEVILPLWSIENMCY